VAGKIRLGPRRTHRGGKEPPGSHTKTGNQSQRAVSDILKLT
jgi:hypothetical protein